MCILVCTVGMHARSVMPFGYARDSNANIYIERTLASSRTSGKHERNFSDTRATAHTTSCTEVMGDVRGNTVILGVKHRESPAGYVLHRIYHKHFPSGDSAANTTYQESLSQIAGRVL